MKTTTSVTYEGPDVPIGEQCPVLGEFATVREAELFIGQLFEFDEDGVSKGYYGINHPVPKEDL